MERDLTRLRYVRLGAGEIRWDLFPDFLIVGPQRTGTTWLYMNLILHPEVMLTVPKELYFWSSLKSPDSPRFVSAELDSYLRWFDEPSERRMEKDARCRRVLATPYRPRVRGEATASYAALDLDVIDEICALNPAIKVLLTVRHPVERAWSHAKKDLARKLGRRIEEVPARELEEFFTRPYQLRCARYGECIANWRSRLRAGHLLVGSFDDLRSRPEGLLLDVMRFLDVRADPRHGASRMRDVINVTGDQPIPDRQRRFLEELLGREIVEFERGF
jgi:hypothetical protein